MSGPRISWRESSRCCFAAGRHRAASRRVRGSSLHLMNDSTSTRRLSHNCSISSTEAMPPSSGSATTNIVCPGSAKRSSTFRCRRPTESGSRIRNAQPLPSRWSWRILRAPVELHSHLLRYGTPARLQSPLRYRERFPFSMCLRLMRWIPQRLRTSGHGRMATDFALLLARERTDRSSSTWCGRALIHSLRAPREPGRVSCFRPWCVRSQQTTRPTESPSFSLTIRVGPVARTLPIFPTPWVR